MDEFEIVDKNSLEIDINEQNLNTTCNISNNDISPDKDQDFSIISEMKNEDVENIANIVESDCTSPLSIENVDLNSESAENINHESMKYDSYPLTMFSIPLSTLDANKQNIDNCAEVLIENLDKVNLLNVNEEKENKHEDSFIGNFQRNEETDSIKVNDESLFSLKNIDVTVKNNPIEENNELDRETSKSEDKKELINTTDEPDFRVNIIDRNDSEDKWSTNAYIHNDNIEKSSDKMKKTEEKNELDRETIKTEEKKELNNTDEPDFRVNIIERNDSEDKWSTNAYIHNDNDEKSSDNINKTEEKNVLDKETEEKKELINTTDEPDFRVNIIERNDSEDKWSTSTFAHEKEISSDTEKVANRLINSEINSSNLEVIKSDSVESSSKEVDESDSKNNESVNNGSNGNENCNQQSENEIISSQEKSEENMNIELQKEDISNTKVTQAIEPVIIRPLGVDDPITFPGMSAVIHMLFNCVEFRKKMIEYHHTDQIAYFDLESNRDIKSEDLLFINDLCKLFVVMKEKNLQKICEVGRSARKYFRELGFQLNAEKGFEYILEKINSITRTVSDENHALTKEEDIAFFKYKCLNKSFVSDLLTGQIMNTTFCCKCQKEHEKTFEHIRYLSLKIPKEKNNASLEDCIQNLFNEVKIETSHNYNCCSEPDIKLNRKFTHIPEYLFIHLDRKLENNERDNTFVEIDSGIFFESGNGIGVYSLCSVIDEIFVHQTFLNSVKCLSDAWWNIEYINCRKIAPFEIITGSSIGFMFKKQID